VGERRRAKLLNLPGTLIFRSTIAVGAATCGCLLGRGCWHGAVCGHLAPDWDRRQAIAAAVHQSCWHICRPESSRRTLSWWPRKAGFRHRCSNDPN